MAGAQSAISSDWLAPDNFEAAGRQKVNLAAMNGQMGPPP